MVTGYTAGSVSAKIELDTSDFDKKIKGLKNKVDDLKVALQKNGLSDVSRQLKEFQETISKQQETIDKLKDTMAEYKKQLKSLRNELKTGTTEAKKNKNAVKELSKETEKYNEAIVKATKSEQLFRKNYEQIKTASYLGKPIAQFKEIKKATDEATASTKRYYTEAGKELGAILKTSKELNKTPKGNKVYHGGIPGLGVKASVGLNAEQIGYEIGKKALQDFLKVVAEAPIKVKRSSTEIENAMMSFAQYGKVLQRTVLDWRKLNSMLKQGTFNPTNTQLSQAAKALNTFNRGLRSTEINWRKIKSMANIFDPTIAQLSKAGQSFNNLEKIYLKNAAAFDKLKQGMTGFAPVTEKTFSAATQGAERYRQKISQLSAELKKQYAAQEQYYASVGSMSWKYWRQIRNSTVDNNKVWNSDKSWQTAQFKAQTVGLQNYYQNINKVTSALAKLEKQQNALKLDTKAYSSTNFEKAGRALQVMNKELERNITLEKRRRSATFQADSKAYSTANFQKASQGLALLNKQQETNIKNLKETGQWAMQSGRGLTSFNNGVVQTAHSGRILSNTLYQIRGALLSLKMIFTAMGGMALWGFATEIAEGVKTTFAAKNEMEAQLKQNAKVGESGIVTFNRALDNTISRFKKINKYALGETVSSIGLEFELTSKQMEKAMPIVSMIQSEYVRAGRTSEEAALAVKDILQGEFQRLSRETGVGKEELIAYGWDEDKTNIDGLLKALEKAAKDRHWDVFAAKATSLNDVIQITKSRFEEFGADLLQSISPLIVGAFNTLADGLDGLKKAFDGLGSFGKNSVFAGLVVGITTLIGTGLPMVSKGMGLADIATIGWSKSLGTAVFNLNKATVAQYGFRKALAEVITGTKASELANVRSTKAIMGRLLGVKQSVLAEHGYMTALVQSKGVLKNHTGATNIAKISSMGLAQKLAYLTGNMKLQDAQALKTTTAIRKFATSWKVLRTAMLGVIGIAAIAWYSSMATWADTVRKNIEGLNEVIDNGDSMLKEAQTSVSDYETALSKLTEGTIEYKKAANNLEVAKANEKDITAANKLAKAYKKQNEETEKNIANRHKMQMARSYELAGIDRSKASEMASGWTRKVEAGEKNWIDSMNIYNDRLYKSNQHINEHIQLMNKAGLSEEQRLKYIDEYSMKAEEVAENWKKFNQGDMTAGAYAVLGELQLQWIDLWNNDRFLNFWNSAKDTWEDIKPTVWAIKDALQELGNVMLDFFSTKHGQLIGGIALFGTAIGIVGLKVGKWVTGAKSTFDVLKKLGKPIKDRIKDWKDLGDKVEEANEKMGGDKSTGGINGNKSKGWWNKGQIQSDVQNYTRAAVAIAAGMVLITEAIVLLNAPMLALAGTGVVFEHTEPQVKAGIKGLQLIAPTVIALMTPMIALMYVFNKFNITSEQLTKGFKDVAVGIALAITLVTEAIILLNAPLLGLAILGSVYNGVEDSVRQGIKAMDIVNQSLRALVPWIPVFVGGIALAALAFAAPEIGLPALAAVAIGIGIGILAVTEAIVGLNIPLAALAQTGQNYTDTDMANVRKGAEAMKVTAEALGYVEEGVRAMMLVKWEIIASNLADVVAQLMGHNIGDDLVKLTEENGFLDQMEKFAQGFNNKTFTAINPDKAAAFKTVADSLNSLNSALESAKTAIANIPAEFKNGGNGEPLLSYDAATDSTAVTGSADTEGYFDQLKQPIEDLAKFMDWFNGIEITAPKEDKVAALTASASMVEQINNAVEQVKNTMGTIAQGNIATNIAQTTGNGSALAIPFGGIGAIAGLVNGLTGGGTGDYKSSIGSQLYEMEMVLTDLTTFNNNIAGLGGGNTGGNVGSGNVEALSGMVTAVSDAISKLEQTLSQAVPNIKTNASNIGKGISEGIKTGIGDLTTLVVPPLVTAMNAMKANAYTYGKGVGDRGKQGIKETFKVKETIDSELRAALWVMDSKKQHFYNKGYQLGQAAAQGVKDGDDMHSPGIMSRTFMQEMDYIDETFDVAIRTAPQKAYMLGETLANNFNPNLGLGGLSVDDLSQFQTGLDQISYMANSTDMQTSAAFTDMNLTANTSMTGMTTSVNGAFNNIQQNTTTKYGQIVNTTRTSLNNMQSQTTRNINAIKTSWKGMQTALIASAENIRSQTSQKIHTLESNMASFWRKIQNPANLLSGAGNPHMAGHTIRRRASPSISTPKTSKRLLSSRPAAGNSKLTGISNSFHQTGAATKNSKLRGKFAEYLQCLLNGGNCMAGGWDFNWTPKIMNALKGWKTHFGEIYDPYLNVGKFENDNFPVRGIKEIALNYIEDAIGRTDYDFYWDYRYDPLTAWNRGKFNCMDGARLAIAFANAFGFGGGEIRHTSWDGIGHGYAYIPGLGNIDATAIQGGYGLTAGKVHYAGSHTINRSSTKPEPMGTVVNGGVTVNVTIEGNVDNAEETGRRIGEEASKTVLDILKRSPATGL